MISEIIPQLCGLVICILLFVFYMLHKNLKIYRERIFYICLCVTTISLTVDIFSIFCIYYPKVFNETFTKVICKSYLVALVCCTLSTLVYIYTYIFNKKTHKSFLWYSLLFTLVLAVALFISPINLVTDVNSVYTNGNSVLLTYIACAIFVLASIISVIIFWKKINNRRAFAMILWLGIWVGGALFQFFNNEAPVVGFCASIGILIQCTIVENPEGNIDREYGCFNSYAFVNYIDSLAEDDAQYCALEVHLEGLNEERREEEKAIVKAKAFKVVSNLNKIKQIHIFKNVGSGFIGIIKNKTMLEEYAALLKDVLKEYNLLDKNICITLVNNASIFANSNHLQAYFDHLKFNHIYGSSRIYYATDDETEVYSGRYLISNEIERAIQEDRVEVFFQPIYSLKDKMYSGAEALVRIRNKDGTLLPPGEFIPVAEETGQISKLSPIIFTKICDFLAESDVINLGLKTIDFNLSVSECRNPNLADDICAVAEKYNIDPKHLILEVTETSSLQERDSFINNMHKLIDKGFKFALDDFGKGESNLGYIIDMPVSVVKIDFSLSKAYFKSDKARTVINSVISMAHELNMHVVCEGVETKEENETFINEKVDFIQGFYHSNALPMSDFINFIAEKNAN